MLKLLLAAAIPFQSLVDKTSPTHGFINRQALLILSTDRRVREAEWLVRFLGEFNAGCDWADSGWKNISHMYDPRTGQGLKGWPSAPQVMREYWSLATRCFAEGKHAESFHYLGAAAHLVQDLCVPHHAAARILAGHKQFERYARNFRHHHAVIDGGLYDLARTPEGWVTTNASYTRERYSECIARRPSAEVIAQAVADLLPRAQRATAGFVAYFLRQVGAR